MKLNIQSLKESEDTLIILHLSDKKEDLANLEFLLPILQQSNIGFSILTREKKSFNKIKKMYPNLQILFAKSPVDVESAINAQQNLKVVLYAANTAKNLHLLRFNSLQHIYIGLSKFNDIDKTYRAYDEIWVHRNSDYDKILRSTIDLRHLKIYNIRISQFENNLNRIIE